MNKELAFALVVAVVQALPGELPDTVARRWVSDHEGLKEALRKALLPAPPMEPVVGPDSRD